MRVFISDERQYASFRRSWGSFTRRLSKARVAIMRDITRSPGCSHCSNYLSLAALLSSPSSLPFLSVPFIHIPRPASWATQTRSACSTTSASSLQPKHKDLMFGIVNEAYLPAIGRDVPTSFYLQAHDMIRGIMGYGARNGPFIRISRAPRRGRVSSPARTTSSSTLCV
ncbi:hypothetical protein C8R45DRAFT_1094685 [Mycena sanguinolenta]|nr:hypothetical protein C8R45DRAFT_1094685 [Mycena sanguinolenta]